MSEFIDYVFQRSTSLNKIDNSLYSKYNVKNGLRNEDGTGVLVGLTKISDVVGYKKENDKKIDTEVINNSARDIKGNASKFITMTQKVFNVSSIDSADVKVYNDKYNIKMLLKEINQKYKNEAKNKNLNFITNIASDIPTYLYGDSIGLKKVLGIILGNSIKYTSSGYIDFKVDTVVKQDIVRLIITIEDSGRGIPVDKIDKIFMKQDKKTTDSLYEANKLITLMNGAIIPSSIYGTGTTMKIVLDQKFVIEKDDFDKYAEIYEKKKILLIDDSENSEKLFNKILNNDNVIIDSVRLGKEGLDKIRAKEKYDLILLDEDMEPLDGHSVMKKFNQIEGFNTKVILLTKNNNVIYDDYYKDKGFSDYILKPIDKRELINKILDNTKIRLYTVKNSYVLNNPSMLYKYSSQKLDHIISKLEVLNPLNTLNRGYAIIKKDNKVLSSIKKIKENDVINISLKDGEVTSKIIRVGE